MAHGLNTFLLVLAAIFPVVNPPGTALVFLALTRNADPTLRRKLAWHVARNSLVVLVCSLVGGALILRFYGISVPVLRVAGGYIVAVTGWTLLKEGSHKDAEGSDAPDHRGDLLDQAFYPLTFPLTTGPGTIAVMISIGLSHPSLMDRTDQVAFLLASASAIGVIAGCVFLSFSYAGRVQSLLGKGGMDIAVRLSAFILFCLGVQILWSGLSELLKSLLQG